MRRFLVLMVAVMLASTAIAQYTLLEWSAPLTGDPVVKYRIYKGSDEMSLALYDSVMGDPADTEYVDEVIDEDESVFYRVRGIDAEGLVGAVTVLNETLVDLTSNTPTQLYADGDITMNWSALANATEYSVADADSYRIRWMYGASAWTYDSEPVVAGEVEFTLGTVEADETYVIQAMAVYGGWPADWSTTVGDTVQVSTASAVGDTIMYVWASSVGGLEFVNANPADQDTLMYTDQNDSTQIWITPRLMDRISEGFYGYANAADSTDVGGVFVLILRAQSGLPLEIGNSDRIAFVGYPSVQDSLDAWTGYSIERAIHGWAHSGGHGDNTYYAIACSSAVWYEWLTVPASMSTRNMSYAYSDAGETTPWSTHLSTFSAAGVGSVTGGVPNSSMTAYTIYPHDITDEVDAAWSGDRAGVIVIYADKGGGTARTWDYNYASTTPARNSFLILEVVK